MSALIQARLTPQAAHEAMVTARRYGAGEAAGLGIIDHAVPEDAVLSTAIELAQAQAGKAGHALRIIKTRLYPNVLEALALSEI
jgi:enoyl-CoA hydratase/carnithine racemase